MGVESMRSASEPDFEKRKQVVQNLEVGDVLSIDGAEYSYVRVDNPNFPHWIYANDKEGNSRSFDIGKIMEALPTEAQGEKRSFVSASVGSPSEGMIGLVSEEVRQAKERATILVQKGDLRGAVEAMMEDLLAHADMRPEAQNQFIRETGEALYRSPGDKEQVLRWINGFYR